MCGFVGILSVKKSSSFLRDQVQKMGELIRHRGPDGAGLWSDPDLGVCLGHRRLAIIDPEHGKQPLETEDGRHIIVFNGEIYNYLEIREELLRKGHPIKSFSDTEVLLYAYREWGEGCVDHLLGMFAFAIWDRQTNSLFCARDRVGIKPFYYFFDGSNLAIASEIKALFASNLVTPESDHEGLQDYLTFQFCLGDKTMFKNIKKLEPGWTMTIRFDAVGLKREKKMYWDVNFDTDHNKNEGWFTSQLSELLEDAVRLHLRSDVPLGAHLSGGLDSSTVVCLASKLLPDRHIKTFTGAFPEGERFDETAYAKSVTQETGAEYHEIFIQGANFPEILPKLIYYMDEPVAGPGLIPQYYVSQLAAQHVKVVLGGQGGDEIFMGYARYLIACLENCLSESIFGIKDKKNGRLTLESLVPNLPILTTYKPMMQKFLKQGVFDSLDYRYFRLIDRSEGVENLYSEEIFQSDYSAFDSFQTIFNRPGIESLVDKMSYFDLKASLPALLHVEDRTSMAASIESRVPLLDHRIIELLARVPENIKFRGGDTKHLFKNVVRNIVPSKIYNRKDKMGFPTPLDMWCKGNAKDFVYDTLFSTQARQRGLYNIKQVKKALEDKNEFSRVVWGLLCMETWYTTFIDQ